MIVRPPSATFERAPPASLPVASSYSDRRIWESAKPRRATKEGQGVLRTPLHIRTLVIHDTISVLCSETNRHTAQIRPP